MNTLHRVGKIVLAAALIAQSAAFAPASADEQIADLGAMTVLSQAGLAPLGSMTVSAARAPVAELGSLTVTARRGTGYVVAQARSGVASEAPRVHSWN